MAVEELGTTFIKLGQILSTRADLLPPEYQVELARLQDSAPGIPFDDIETAFVNEFGAGPSELYETFEERPLAAASIGQAHAATLPGGREFVVKIRCPGVVDQVETDLDIVHSLARRADRNWRHAAEYDLVNLVNEFADSLHAELDYVREGHSAERFSTNFARDTLVHVPDIYWEITSSQIITLERVRGIKISDLDALDEAGIDRSELAQRAARMLLKMVFEDGFFHADPHPTNFFIESDGSIGLIDFGMVGIVDEPTQLILTNLLVAIVSHNTESLVDALLDLGTGTHHLNRLALQHDLQRLLNQYYDVPLSDLEVGKIIGDTQATIRAHRLQLPSNLALLLKTTIMAEGLGVMLDPSFRLAEVLAPYSQQFMLRQYSPKIWMQRWRQAGLDVAQLGSELPARTRRILSDLEQGRVQIGLRQDSFESSLERIELLINRLVLGILAAAFIVGMASLLAIYRPPGWDALAGIIFAFGLLIAVALGIYLTWSIFRSGRR